ncbi:hypothetical protein J1614_008576 [Plenodomus biglobosus]|nr:hypothetical protein J1614_008576 [Plenodomus biglobosus]
MLISTLIGLVAGLAVQAVDAACSGPLKIDDFSKYASNQNSLGSWTSDDGSMTSIKASGGVLSFTPKSSSYFYETFPCQQASSTGYNSLTFQIKGPAGGSATLEIQTKTACSATAYTSKYIQLSGFTGSLQTMTVPLSQFAGANLNAVQTFVWSGFSSTTYSWQLSNVAFGCGGAVAPSSTKASSSVVRPSSTMATVSSPSPSSGTCKNLLIDDFRSQSRLTFMFYNAFNYPTSSDGTMKSVTVGKPSANRVEFVPNTPGEAYFYSQMPCTNAKGKYGGISLRIKAPKGTTLNLQLDSSATCDPEKVVSGYASTADLGWTFDGTEKLYSIPFSKFPGINLEKLVTVLFSGYSNTVSFGPMSLYCGNTVSEYVVPTNPTAPEPSTTVPAPSNPSASTLVIDKFANSGSNALGFWHGGDEGMTLTYGGGQLKIVSPDADYAFYTQVSAGCSDFTKYKGSYLHIAYSGSTKFTVSFQQHNSKCNANIAPYPETWDSAEASRYANNGHIYIPINHFNINLSRVVGFALKGFYSSDPVTLSTIEIVSSVPAGTIIPAKAATGNLIFACKRPNSFAFAIDDGIPSLAQDVLKIIREENIKVTFFTVGAPLVDSSTNLTNVYREMQAAGHQLALHSFTHPKMESLPDYAAIDWEYNEDIKAMKNSFNGLDTPYFRPPFGNEGARMRSRLSKAVGPKATIVNWSVDVEDWLWAETNTPEQQKVAFQRDVDKGGNLVVLHYLYPSTVSYLREFIQIAKKSGKQLMRVDQCMEDPSAPPL